ncbi:hypothetical protein NL676_006161 [Syzygium grande]|nr:hypothetical protein NL676_006161 [Syzygium grande]
MDCMTAREVWRKCAVLYSGRNNMSRVCDMWEALFEAKIGDSGLAEHYANFTSLYQRLRSYLPPATTVTQMQQREADMLVVLFLRSLGPDHSALRQQIVVLWWLVEVQGLVDVEVGTLLLIVVVVEEFQVEVFLVSCGVYMLLLILRRGLLPRYHDLIKDRKTGRRIGGGREAGGLYLPSDPEIIAAISFARKKSPIISPSRTPSHSQPLQVYTRGPRGLESRLFTSGRLTTFSGTSF